MEAQAPNYARRNALRAAFKAQVAAGTMQPLVLPYCVLGTFIIPVLYFCISHRKRPWLRKARFAVWAVCVALNLRMISHTSSTNMAMAYAAGLLGTWGFVWNAALLLFMDPQRDSKRVEKRRRSSKGEAPLTAGKGVERSVNGGTTVTTIGSGNGEVPYAANGQANDHAVLKSLRAQDETILQSRSTAPDESVAEVIDDYEYFWQSFPEGGSFLSRLDWATDLCTAFRGSGWSHCISALPQFNKPASASSSELVDLTSLPLNTRAGYFRLTTYRAFLYDRLTTLAINYLILDFVGVMMMHDPYFVFGPAYTNLGHALPTRLASLHPWTLHALRSAWSFFGVLSALTAVFTLHQLVCVVLLRPLGYGVRSDLWQYPSIAGSFDAVLDHGLPGFWGSWWHQTFRLAFTAPTDWLVSKGYLKPRTEVTKAIGSLIAFVESGILHAGGSYTTLPQSWFLMPPAFFLLSWVGIMAQTAFSMYFKKQIAYLPRLTRRAGNLAFVVLFLHFTAWPFLNDLARSAVWLLEPVPISIARPLGLGHPGDHWWRWDRDHFPVWYIGKTWWETGVGL